MNGDVGVFLRQTRVSLGGAGDSVSALFSDGRRAAAPLAHLIGEELQYQVTLALDLRRARPRLQLKPGVVADDWHFLRQKTRGQAHGRPLNSARTLFSPTHIQGDVDAAEEVIGVLLRAR